MLNHLPAEILQALCVPAETSINHVLQYDPAALHAMARHQGRLLAIRIIGVNGVSDIFVRIFDNGIGLSLMGDSTADATLTGSIRDFLALARADDKANTLINSAIDMDGDSEFAIALTRIAQQLDIDWEALISPLTGGLLAHQLGKGLRGLMNWGKSTSATYRTAVKEYLEENNFIVTTAIDALDAKRKLNIIKFDILILDVMMPGESGLSLTKELKKTNTTPIILLTAKGETIDRIQGLELGADDYLGKPFEPKELLLRIKNILNKVQKPIEKNEVYIGDTLINLKKLYIQKNNKTIKINPQEKKILEKMLEVPGKVFSRDDMGKIINISKERTVDVMITRLRQKIESNPKNPKYLQTIRGSGYVLWIE